MIHRKGKTIVVTKACRERRLRSYDDVLDFVGSADERLTVVRLWDEICADAARRSAERRKKQRGEV
jgi:hypothetical protein